MSGHRPTYVEINLSALLHNFHQVRRQAGSANQILAVVKADAYGHGAVPVALTLQRAGVDQFGVALAEEGMALRRAGIEQPILVLGGLYPGQEEDLLRFQLTPAIFSLEAARRLNRMATEQGVFGAYHLKLDTGMGRVGFRLEELTEILAELTTLSRLRMTGVISHLAMSDEPERPFTDLQQRRFRDGLDQIRRAGFAPEFTHIGNSAAIFTRDIPECNLVRPGIVLYGALPAPGFAGKLNLKPVMSFYTRIAQIKRVPAGTGVSYGHRYLTERESVLAALPVGYADGYNRLLSNCGEVLIRGQRARVAGTVCMDWTLVDVTHIPEVEVGDAVVLLGEAAGERISAEDWAEKIGSISYEVFCRISSRVPRVYVDA